MLDLLDLAPEDSIEAAYSSGAADLVNPYFPQTLSKFEANGLDVNPALGERMPKHADKHFKFLIKKTFYCFRKPALGNRERAL